MGSRNFSSRGGGRTVRSDFGSLRVTKALGENRAAVIVSKGRLKRAVDRNRLRRVVYADLAGFFDKISLQTKLFFYPTAQVIKLKPQDRRRTIEKLLHDAGVLK